MPNFSDYDRETGELLNPDFWNGPPDNRTIDEKVRDYFDPSHIALFFSFSRYKDWMFFPPRIETADEGEKIINDWIESEFEKLRGFGGGVSDEKIEKYMDMFEIREHIRGLVERFVMEGKPKGWSIHRERDKIREELGEKVVKQYEEDETYIVEFQVVQTYQFQAHTKMTIDDLLEYYIDEETGVEKPELLQKVIDGKVVPVGKPEMVDESLEITQVRGESNTIVERRRLEWLK